MIQCKKLMITEIKTWQVYMCCNIYMVKSVFFDIAWLNLLTKIVMNYKEYMKPQY